MGAEGVLIDTGPLVALLNRSDQWHEWARDRAMRFDAPVLSCEAVLSEVSSGSVVCTLEDDFSIYRQFGQKPIPLIAP